MINKKRIGLTIIILLAIGLLFRGLVYWHLVGYKSIGIRANYSATNHQLIELIDSKDGLTAQPDIEQIIKLGLSITSAHLNFTASDNDNDPNKLIDSKTAHCVGYASFFTVTCNHLLDKYSLNDKWTATSNVGQLYFLGRNVHTYFDSPFFKDHDFVTIQNASTGQVFAVDPTVNDYLGIDHVNFIK